MHDVERMAPVAQPSAEELRMKYPPIGCWGPTCVLIILCRIHLGLPVCIPCSPYKLNAG